jgi:hypothetical protein
MNGTRMEELIRRQRSYRARDFTIAAVLASSLVALGMALSSCVLGPLSCIH